MINSRTSSLMNKIGQTTGSQTDTCDIHGVFTSLQRRVLGGRSVWSQCNQCMKIRDDERAVRERNEEQLRKDGQRIESIENKMTQLGIAPRYYNSRLDNYKVSTEAQERVVSVFKRIISISLQPKLKRNLDKCFIVTGDVGVGKTHLLSALTIEMSKEDLTTLYTTSLRMIKTIRGAYSGQGKEDDLIALFTSPDMLVIDEVGVQFGTDAERVTFYEVINRRYENMKMTILASNLNEDGLRELLGDRIMRRLLDSGVTLALGGGE